MNNPEVLVLLSSYNGEKYIKEQIDSILTQKNITVKLFIRDDGSTDATRNILKKYEKYSNCVVVFGDNIGAANSFLWLIQNAHSSGYYAFSDQDDIWDRDKLSSAISIIKSTGSTLYHGFAGKVDKNLNKIKDDSHTPADSFGGSLLESATGCTMVFTKALMDKLKSYHPRYISMHDAWVYRVCYALGYSVYYDCNSHMKYRQHESNVSGGQMSYMQKIAKIKKNRGAKYNVAQSIKTCCWHDMPEQNRIILQAFLGYKCSFYGKLRVMMNPQFSLNKTRTNIQNKILLIFNLI